MEQSNPSKQQTEFLTKPRASALNSHTFGLIHRAPGRGPAPILQFDDLIRPIGPEIFTVDIPITAQLTGHRLGGDKAWSDDYRLDTAIVCGQRILPQ